MNLCLFCGGDSSEPDHLRKCDGRQGHIEAEIGDEDLPLLISGLTDDTYATSAEAAIRIEEIKATQRQLVFDRICAAGTEGCTDDELQSALRLDGSSERPRRWELWRQDLITIRRTDEGKAIHRRTRTGRLAVVWVARKS
jgi:hypothetical protein